jgi:ABC-type multidrug transport system ATPase subunit
MIDHALPGDAIAVTGLVKRFGSRTVLDSIDLRVPSGQVIGLLGLNGSGKSTLIKCLLGLLRTDAGSALVLGTNAWELADREKSRIGYVPQEATLYPWLTIRQTVAYVSSFYPHWDRAWGEELLARWDLPPGQKTGVLSVGQKQKLALVLALGHRPGVIAGLPTQDRDEVRQHPGGLSQGEADGVPAVHQARAAGAPIMMGGSDIPGQPGQLRR